MTENTFAALLFLVVGVVYTGFGIPLLLDRIPPNYIYGCRTSTTLSNEKIWYAVNRVTGRDMIVGGIAVVIAALGVYLFGRSMNPNYALAILLTVFVLSVGFMVVDSFRTQRRVS